MEFRVITQGELDNIDQRHPELMRSRPDLAIPAFPNNPVDRDDKFPFLFYVLDGDEVVGARRAIPDQLYHKDRVHRWCWCFDTFVDSNHQGKGIGSKLVAKQVEVFDTLGYISGAAFSAPAMMRIYDKLGYQVCEFAPRMALVRNSDPFLAAKIGNSAARALLSPIVNLVLRAEQFARKARAKTLQIALHRITSDELPSLFKEHQFAEQQCRWAGDAGWLISRLSSDDALCKVTDQQTKRPLSFFVLRQRRDEGDDPAPVRITAMDFGLLADEDLGALSLAQGLMRCLKDEQADVLDIVTSDPQLLRALGTLGYRKRGEGMTFVYKLPSDSDLELNPEIANWHLTHFASDGFLFP